MTQPLSLGIDQGTRSTKAVILDSAGEHLFEQSIPVGHTLQKGDCIEQSPAELAQSVRELIGAARRWALAQGTPLRAMGIACQRSGVCAWNDADRVVRHSLITWADRRTHERIHSLGDGLNTVSQLTSLPITAHYAAGKYSLLQEQFPDSAVRIGTLDTYLLHVLADGHPFRTEDTMASRTMLYDLVQGRWSQELCRLFSVTQSRLPPVHASLSRHGSIEGIPVLAMLGDQQAALLGRWSWNLDAVLTLGSISSIGIPLGESCQTESGYITSVLYSAERTEEQRSRVYFLESVSNASANLIEHLLQTTGMLESLSELQGLCEDAVQRRTAAVTFYALGGGGSPEWRYDLPQLTAGWDGHDRAAYVRAIVENIGGFIVSNLRALRLKGILRGTRPRVIVCGGLSESDHLLQFIADASECELLREDSREATARGAALAALLSNGTFQDVREVNPVVATAHFLPTHSSALKRYERWQELRDEVFRGQ